MTQSTSDLRSCLAADFDLRLARHDGQTVLANLESGLNLLRDLLHARAHEDVESTFGKDSMLMPVSASKSERRAKAEIDLYQAVEAADRAIQWELVPAAERSWWLPKLVELRCDSNSAIVPIQRRLEQYAQHSAQERRLLFAEILERVCPESRCLPLVLFRLLPWGVAIATALAFGRRDLAERARQEQLTLLPPIGDCRDCRGRLLDNGQRCYQCGNPLWYLNFLSAA